MYVLYVYVCMYKNPTIGLEHINQKRWAIPHCVRVIHHFASWMWRDQCLDLMYSHCESPVPLSEDSSHSSYMLTLQAGWCLTSAILLFLQPIDDIQLWTTWQHPVFVGLSECNTLTPAMSPHTLVQLELQRWVEPANTLIQNTVL